MIHSSSGRAEPPRPSGLLRAAMALSQLLHDVPAPCAQGSMGLLHLLPTCRVIAGDARRASCVCQSLPIGGMSLKAWSRPCTPMRHLLLNDDPPGVTRSERKKPSAKKGPEFTPYRRFGQYGGGALTSRAVLKSANIEGPVHACDSGQPSRPFTFARASPAAAASRPALMPTSARRSCSPRLSIPHALQWPDHQSRPSGDVGDGLLCS
jgi:hypothetical protein